MIALGLLYEAIRAISLKFLSLSISLKIVVLDEGYGPRFCNSLFEGLIEGMQERKHT